MAARGDSSLQQLPGSAGVGRIKPSPEHILGTPWSSWFGIISGQHSDPAGALSSEQAEQLPLPLCVCIRER